MSDDDSLLFEQEMADVKPLRHDERILLKAASGRDSSQAARRQAALIDHRHDPNTLSDKGVAPLDAWYVLDFKRPGVQNGVFRKLKQGRYEQEARLDLHNMTVAIARRELFDFVEECLGLGLRSVMLVHGKGEHKKERDSAAVLKAYVNVWLQELDSILAFHSAQPRHGGTGAAYVLLRKSDDKKRENRERFMKGRV